MNLKVKRASCRSTSASMCLARRVTRDREGLKVLPVIAWAQRAWRAQAQVFERGCDSRPERPKPIPSHVPPFQGLEILWIVNPGRRPPGSLCPGLSSLGLSALSGRLHYAPVLKRYSPTNHSRSRRNACPTLRLALALLLASLGALVAAPAPNSPARPEDFLRANMDVSVDP